MPATKYKHLFFDLDHTLWDFDANSEAVWRQLYTARNLAGLGLPSFEEFFKAYNIHNARLWERFRNGFIKRDELRWKRVWLTLLDFGIRNLELAEQLGKEYLELLPAQTLLVPHTKELLEHCKGRYTMHLITNGFEETQLMKLRNSGILHYFAEVITSEKSNSMKPHADIFDFACKATGAMVHESLMIGDAIDVDILGAINAGWDSVYYNPARLPHNRKPTYEVMDLKELMAVL